MIKYSQTPDGIKSALKDSYNEEKIQERIKNKDIANPLEGNGSINSGDTMVDSDDGADNN